MLDASPSSEQWDAEFAAVRAEIDDIGHGLAELAVRILATDSIKRALFADRARRVAEALSSVPVEEEGEHG